MGPSVIEVDLRFTNVFFPREERGQEPSEDPYETRAAGRRTRKESGLSGSGRGGRAGIGQVTRRSFAEFSRDDMTTYAAAVSYQVFFSLFPFIIFLLALLGFLNLQPVFDFLL